ncbi:MAG: cysteine synthase family protein [Candidatus Korarchaeota archaeon]|nr:cysteine synthase family protein [Candidatus Korarchaeota archaeon]NIU84116.1 pyridoxal-phosphate dependent enzyme [Candidatus Thorarchaeota archaeon]NIW14256.1 pyridoxal-phosphate dependent enzyme [Candidatus Thorarchaeota archaeon]NIW52352.1 pyridoxal-phosphate dependent enzyme [Candidatus Korarchaeota archaeon]
MKDTILATIGKTPLLPITLNRRTIYAKAEFMNPSGSIKDRIAKYMIEWAEKEEKLTPGDTIVEATAGNTGTSLAMVSAVKGYNFIAVMPEDVGGMKKRFIRAFNGQVREAPPGDFGLARKTAIELGEKPHHWCPKQFSNPDNPKAQEILGEEISTEMKQVDVFVAGVGTGGTLIGVGRVLKRKFSHMTLIAVEPAESPVLSEGKFAHHKIEGIAEGFVAEITKRNWDLIDAIVQVKSDAAVDMAKSLSKEKGLPVGVSAGANIIAALRSVEKGNVVTVLPDRRDRYPKLLF